MSAGGRFETAGGLTGAIKGPSGLVQPGQSQGVPTNPEAYFPVMIGGVLCYVPAFRAQQPGVPRVLDTFSQAGSPTLPGQVPDIGAPWSSICGSWGVDSVSGAAVPLSTANLSPDAFAVAVIDSGVADGFTAQLTLTHLGVGTGWMGIGLRCLDSKNMLGIEVRFDGSCNGNRDQNDSSFGTAVAAAGTFGSGDVLIVTVAGNVYTVYRNSLANNVGSYVDGNNFNLTVTKHGVWWRQGIDPNARCDNFEITVP